MQEPFRLKAAKRLLDVVGSGLALLVALPAMAIVALLVWVTLGRPVLFRQQRPGRHGQPFTIFKFRTLTEEHDESGRLLPDEQRLTRLGRILRGTSLDELPELMNVLKGDMSIVGPRPLLTRYLDRYTPEQARRHEVKPGLTGWAQVHGRNCLDWEEKFALDVWYVDNLSLWLDFKIVVLTGLTLLSRRGINQPGQATMSEFLGTDGRRSGGNA